MVEVWSAWSASILYGVGSVSSERGHHGELCGAGCVAYGTLVWPTAISGTGVTNAESGSRGARLTAASNLCRIVGGPRVIRRRRATHEANRSTPEGIRRERTDHQSLRLSKRASAWVRPWGWRAPERASDRDPRAQLGRGSCVEGGRVQHVGDDLLLLGSKALLVGGPVVLMCALEVGCDSGGRAVSSR